MSLPQPTIVVLKKDILGLAPGKKLGGPCFAQEPPGDRHDLIMNVVRKRPPANSLADFDLDDAAIATIVKNAHSERRRLTGNAPSNARGSTFYFWIVSGLREHLLGLGRGWAKGCVQGLEVVEHKEKRIRLAYVAAEGASGPEMTSSPRGPMSVAAAERNGQLRLFAVSDSEQPRTIAGHPAMSAAGFKTWFLAIEPNDGVYRLALALPTETEVNSGRFVTWAEHIPIADVAIDSEPNNHVVEPSAPLEATTPPKPKRRRRGPLAKASPVSDLTETGTGSRK
jgi:hypothetical protein